MYIIFILFFISLAGIITMIGRKLAPVRSGQIAEPQHQHAFVPDLQKIRHWGYQNIKKYEHLLLVALVRFYIRFSNFLKQEYSEIKAKITNLLKAKKIDAGGVEIQEPSKFLKVVSEYKQRIRHIKNRITEEEENK